MIKLYMRLLLLGLALATSAFLSGCVDYGNVPPGMYVFGVMPGPGPERGREGHRHPYGQYRREQAHGENAPRYENRDHYNQGQGSQDRSHYNYNQRYRQHSQYDQVQGSQYPDQNSQINGPQYRNQNSQIQGNQTRSREHRVTGRQLQMPYGARRDLRGHRKHYAHQVQRQQARYRNKQRPRPGKQNNLGQKHQNHNQYLTGQAG